MKHYFLLFLMFAGCYLLPLAFRPMITPDEFRYAEIPREMIESGNWVKPQLGGMDYFEKPVLGYQLTALSFKLFGFNKFGLRFPAALATGLTALLAALFFRRYLRNNRAAALAGVLYLDFGLVFALGNAAVLDAPLALFTAGTLASFLPACLAEKWDPPRVILLLASGVFAGCGFLTKGFVALAVPVLTILPFLIWEKRWKAFIVLPWIPLAAFIATTAPWAILIHRQAPDFWRYFIVVEHFQRFTGSAGVGQRVEPWWFFAALLIPLLLPGGLLLGCAARGLRGQWSGLLKQSYGRYLVCWFVFPFLFFSVCRGKLATYILPCFLPVAVLGAAGIAEYFRLGGKYRTFRFTMTGMGIVLIAAGIAGIAAGLPDFPPEFPVEKVQLQRFWPAGAAAVLFGIGLLWQRNMSWNKNLLLFFGGQSLIIFLGLWALLPDVLGDKTPEACLKRLQPHLPGDGRIFVHRLCMHGALWTWRRTDLTLAWAEGEWDYTVHRGGNSSRYVSAQELIAYLKREDRGSCAFLICEDLYRKFQKMFPEGAELHRDRQLMLMVYPERHIRP